MPFDPLLQALGSPGEDNGPQRVVLKPPRVLRTDVTEIENGRTALPGQPVTLMVVGTIKLIDEDGDILVNVTRVDGKKASEDDDVIRPQESDMPTVKLRSQAIPS